MSSAATSPFRNLPSVDSLLIEPPVRALIDEHGRTRVLTWAREAVAQLRRQVSTEIGQSLDRAELIGRAVAGVCRLAFEARLARLGPVINATGVVLHTNLGRAPLADKAIDAVQQAARYCNLEMDLETGARHYRGFQLESLWRELTGAEAAFVVNNCASATLIALQSLARGRQVIVSRGELIEIGGSYRLPDVFRESGAVLREVGTTNRTRLADYESAIGPETAGLLKAHQSNFRVVGFTESVTVDALAELAHRRGLFAIDDIGSGCLYDLRPYGLPAEPSIRDSLAAGADLVLFSGDKLFGGPQCGILLGKRELIERIRKSPVARAVRIDKLTLAALQATIEIHLADRAFQEIPVLRQLAVTSRELRERAERIVRLLESAGKPCTLEIHSSHSAVGGGSLPTAELPTCVLALRSSAIGAAELARRLRTGLPPVLARVESDTVLLDLRTVLPHEESDLIRAVTALASA
jgi:L-seryl-tRNA(Ser) seleniumtransferase